MTCCGLSFIRLGFWSPISCWLGERGKDQFMSGNVAVLFARRDSIYKAIPGCDVYDEDRDARSFPGYPHIVAHPPCRAWSKMRHFAKPVSGEKDLALFAVDQVRQFGGVLEHPRGSLLWKTAGLPGIGEVDQWGGWTLPVFQCWFGHKAEKSTLLYVVGCKPAEIPIIPLSLAEPTHVVAQSKKRYLENGARNPGLKPELSKADRERTPPEFAQWLIDLARRCHV